MRPVQLGRPGFYQRVIDAHQAYFKQTTSQLETPSQVQFLSFVCVCVCVRVYVLCECLLWKGNMICIFNGYMDRTRTNGNGHV